MKEFDRNVKKDGKNKICNSLLKEFPEYVRK